MEYVPRPLQEADAIGEVFLTPAERGEIEKMVNEYTDNFGANPEKVIAFLRANKNYLWEFSSQLQNAYKEEGKEKKEEGKEKGDTMPFYLLEKIIEKLL